MSPKKESKKKRDKDSKDRKKDKKDKKDKKEKKEKKDKKEKKSKKDKKKDDSESEEEDRKIVVKTKEPPISINTSKQNASASKPPLPQSHNWRYFFFNCFIKVQTTK